ncbi:FHA domain-containing protein [Planctomycetota bacterium]
MRLTVKQKDGQSSEYNFHEDPIHIGRGTNNQVFLPDRSVSKHHAVIFSTEEGNWMLEDLDSANKTYLNGQPVTKSEIKTGDNIKITDFTMDVFLDAEEPSKKQVQAEDTIQLEASLGTPRSETVVRRPDAGHAPAMRLPAKRLTDFAKATDIMADVQNLEQLLVTLLDNTVKQFSAFHVWCALREQPNGPMTYHAGKRRDGKPVELADIGMADKINNAVERNQSLVLPRVSAQLEGAERIRSAMIASIMNHSGSYGIIYVDNAMVHEHYSLSDLDYLMFLAIHTASVLKKLLQ